MTETDLLNAVMALAKLRGWRAYHAIPSLSVRGRYLTAYKGDRGLPDVLMARDGQFIAAELKDQTGTLGPGQAEWGVAFGQHHRLWRPSDLERIKDDLR